MEKAKKVVEQLKRENEEILNAERQRLKNIEEFLSKLDKSDELNSLIEKELLEQYKNIEAKIKQIKMMQCGIIWR